MPQGPHRESPGSAMRQIEKLCAEAFIVVSTAGEGGGVRRGGTGEEGKQV